MKIRGKFARRHTCTRTPTDVETHLAQYGTVETEPLSLEALVEARNVLGDKVSLAVLDHSHYAEAEEMYRQAGMAVLGEEHQQTLQMDHDLAFALSLQGRHAEAERIYRHVGAVQQRLLGDEHLETLESRHDMTIAISEQGRYAEAEEIIEKLLAVEQRVVRNIV